MPTCSRQTLVKDHAFLVKTAYYLKSLYGVRGFCANSGAGDVAFVIGSSHGLSDEVKRAAALKFSMGRITMPHQLARLVLTEQIRCV